MITVVILIWGLGMIPTYFSFQTNPKPIEYPWDYILSFFWPVTMILFGLVYMGYLLGLIDL